MIRANPQMSGEEDGGEEMSCNGFGSGPLSKIAHVWGVIEKESWEKACLAWTYTKSSCSPSFSFCSSYQRETEGKKVMHQLLNWYHGGILSLGLWVSYKNHTDTDSSLASSSFEVQYIRDKLIFTVRQCNKLCKCITLLFGKLFN